MPDILEKLSLPHDQVLKKVELLDFLVVNIGDEYFAKKNEVFFNNLNIVFADLAPCPRIRLWLHVCDGHLRLICQHLVLLRK